MASTDPWRYTHHLPSDPSFQQPNVRVTSLYVGSEQQTLSSRVQKLDFGEVALLMTTAGLAFLILIPKVNAYCYTAGKDPTENLTSWSQLFIRAWVQTPAVMDTTKRIAVNQEI